MSLITKLGLDLTEFSKGWNKASTIAATGADSIGKVVGRKLGTTDVFKSLFATIGIDAAKIADSIARLYTGVSKDEEDSLKEISELGDKVADANIANMRALLTDEKKYQLSLTERDRLLKRIANRQIKSTQDLVEQKRDELALSEKIKDVQEYEAKKAKEEAEYTKKYLSDRVDLNEKEHDAKLRNLSADKRAKVLEKEVADLKNLQAAGLFLGNDPEKHQQTLDKRTADLANTRAGISEEEQRKKDREFARNELLTRRDRQLRDVGERRTDLNNAVGDRGRLSLTELAGIGSFAPGVSTDLASQGGTAREVLDLQKKAEASRLGGNADDAMALLGQADKLKSGLSALTSGERKDPFEEYKKALRTSEEELADINKTLAGKFTNQ